MEMYKMYLESIQFVAGQNGNGSSCAASPSRSTNAMNVRLHVAWCIVRYHNVHVRNVDTTCKRIRTNDAIDLTVLEFE